MVQSNTQSSSRGLSRVFNGTNPIINLIVLIAILVISGFLIFKSFGFHGRQYQNYQDKIVKLQQLDSDFNQAVLRSRYELFTSYDPLVNNLKGQQKIEQELANYPQFMRAGSQNEFQDILEQINTSATQKIELSERFKSRNALLKNSLRYLPLLTSQLESKLDPQSGITNLDPSQISSLQGNLNQLIRNLLLYNVAVDEKIQREIEILKDSLLQKKAEYGLTPNEFPAELVASHTNIILNTKPQVEKLTMRLIAPLQEETQKLETLLKNSYQRVSIATNIYRVITIGWFLLLLGLLNYWLLNKLRTFNPQFSQYKRKVNRIAKALDRVLASKNNVSELKEVTEIADLTSCRDNLGILATRVTQIAEEKRKEQTVNIQEESFAFLTTNLTLLTKNSQKIFKPQIGNKLQVIFEAVLANKDCLLIDLQQESDKVNLLFRYPPQTRLSQLVKEIKTVSYSLFKQELPEITNELTSQNELWSEAYFITSRDGDILEKSDRALLS